MWLWREATLDENDQALLAKLLAALGTFGRAESWCEANLIDEPDWLHVSDKFQINSRCLNQSENNERIETIRLLMPKDDLSPDELMKVLETETSDMRKSKQLEPTGTRWLTYTRPADILKPQRTISSMNTSKPRTVNIARFALDSNVLPLITEAMPIVELARRALIFLSKNHPHSEVITGKTSDGTPLSGHDHAHYFATDEDGDGRLDHLTIYARRGFNHTELSALGQLRKLRRFDQEAHEVNLILIGLGADEFMAQSKLFQKSAKWRSLTPFSLPRFANRGGGKPPRPRDLPEAQLKRELVSRGFPEPISVNLVNEYKPNDRPPIRWLEFHTTRFNGTKGNGLTGFEIEFAEAQQGPIALGFGCHFGLGLFLPVSQC